MINLRQIIRNYVKTLLINATFHNERKKNDAYDWKDPAIYDKFLNYTHKMLIKDTKLDQKYGVISSKNTAADDNENTTWLN